jgi:hypothetical protein
VITTTNQNAQFNDFPSEISFYFILVTDSNGTVANMHKDVAPPILHFHASATLSGEGAPFTCGIGS